MLRFAIVLLALVVVACSAPAPRAPVDYTDEELMEVAQRMEDEVLSLYDAPPDVETIVDTLLESRAKVCQPDDGQLADIVYVAEGIAKGDAFVQRTERVGVERLPGRGDAFWSLYHFADYTADVRQALGPSRTLVVFEDGHWVSANCEAGRALYAGEGG